MARLKGWETRLLELIRSRRDLPYEYGSNDCACLAQDTIIALTGTDPLPGIVRPKSEREAARFLLSMDCRDVTDLADKVLPNKLASPKLAKRGDLVSFMSEDDEQLHLAVCMGAVAATPGPDKLVYVRMDLWLRAWSI